MRNEIRKRLLFYLIRFNRYALRKKFMRIFSGPLKGYLWSTNSNYDYLVNEYEDPEVLREFFSWLKPDSIFFDIGANTGYYAFLAARKISNGKIYSFEPLPANAEVFRTHMALNSIKIPVNIIELSELAISDHQGMASFSDAGAIEGNTYIQSAKRFKESVRRIEVKTNSIDNLVNAGLNKPDIIKIDVEGAEYDVLFGALQTLQRCKPKLLLATHDCHLPGVKDKCIRLLQQNGYELRHTGYFNKYADGHDDYIAIHPDNP